MTPEKRINAAPEIYWEGMSGVEYGYWIFPIGAELKNRPGNFIYAELTRLRQWLPLYVGQTASLAERLGDRDEIALMRRYGATHVHVHPSFRPAWIRENEEIDLVQRWSPACNGGSGSNEE